LYLQLRVTRAEKRETKRAMEGWEIDSGFSFPQPGRKIRKMLLLAKRSGKKGSDFNSIVSEGGSLEGSEILR